MQGGHRPYWSSAFLGWATDMGLGIHYCLGTWPARIEMREALPILATRLPDLATAGPVAFRPHVGITGPITLPLRFTVDPKATRGA